MLIINNSIRIKKIIRVIILMLIVVSLKTNDTSFARSTTKSFGRSFHKYYTGVVQGISKDGIVFNNQQYIFAQNIKIAAHEKNNNGNFREVAARSNDIAVGAHVIIKVVGTSIYEIIIERWKQ